MEALKLIIFSLAAIGAFTWYANYIPQIESHPPKRISLDARLTEDEMIQAGADVFNGKGTCAICHAIGRPGNRGPDLAGIGAAAGRRIEGYTAKRYLLESLLQPAAYLVEGYGRLMPPVNTILTPGEILVTVAFLQNLGGVVDVSADDVRALMGSTPPQPAANVPPAGFRTDSPASRQAAIGDSERGGRVYAETCAVCHGPDPAVDGPLGPSIAGSTPELVETRVVRAGYPEGYEPKRATALMPPMPHLAEEIVHLQAFLERSP